jgi:hypothetical protein
MDCPVCKAEVEDLTPVSYKGLVVGCPRCGVYRVMESAVAALPRLGVEERMAALQRARKMSSAQSWPTISGACLSSIREPCCAVRPADRSRLLNARLMDFRGRAPWFMFGLQFNG